MLLLLLEDNILTNASNLHKAHLRLLNESLTGPVHLLVGVKLRVHGPREEQLLMTVDLGLDVASSDLGGELRLDLVQRDLESCSDVFHIEALIGCDVSLQIFATNFVVNLVVTEEVVALEACFDLRQATLQQLEPTIKEIIKDVSGLRVQLQQTQHTGAC